MISDTADIHDDLRRKRLGECAAQVVDHAATRITQRRERARKNGIVAFAVVLIANCFATQAIGGENWVLLPEPKFMGHQVTQPIAGAKHTILAVAQMTDLGPEFARREQWQPLGIADQTVLESTRRQAAEWLKTLTPELVRNKQKVVQYARVQSEAVPVAGTVLAPEFWRKFEEIFGPRMRVVIPNRQTVFVFPDLEGNLDQFSPMVFQAWRSRWPKVSLEVFELSERGLKAVGAFTEP